MTKFLQVIFTGFMLALVWIEPTFAQTAGEQTSQTIQEALATLQGLLGVLLAFLNVMIWPLLSMIGGLMSNDLIFGPQVEDRLLLIWGQLRNLVNLVFVLALVAMAIYNVIGPGEESNYTIKKILPKFIIALVVVNFTFVGAKVVLSAINVATTAVYALPSSLEAGFASVNPSELAAANCPNLIETYPENGICETAEEFTPEAESFFSSFSGDNVAYLMAMNLASISDYLQVSSLVLEEPSIQNVTVNIVLSIVMYLMYVISFIVLFFVLLVRVVVLWFVIAVSPLAAIKIVFPDALASLGGDGLDVQDLFVKHAIAPLIIGLGLTIGYLMLDAYYQSSAPSLGTSLQLGADFANAFSAGTSGLQQVLVGFAAVAVIWIVTFAAADNTLASTVTSGIKGALSGLGGQLARFPLYAQWIPIPASIDEDKRASLLNILKGPQGYLSNLESEGSRPINRPNFGQQVKDYISGGSTSNQDMNMRVLRTIKNERDTQEALTIQRFNEIVDAGIADGSIASSAGQRAKQLVAATGLATSATFAQVLTKDGFNSAELFSAIEGFGRDMNQVNYAALPSTSEAPTAPTAPAPAPASAGTTPATGTTPAGTGTTGAGTGTTTGTTGTPPADGTAPVAPVTGTTTTTTPPVNSPAPPVNPPAPPTR